MQADHALSPTEATLKLRTALNSKRTASESAVQLARLALAIRKTSASLGDETRAILWKSYLGIVCVDADFYMRLLKEGPSQADAKIRDDTFRTFKKHKQFWSKVEEIQLIRVLSAFERWHYQDYCIHGEIKLPTAGQIGYVQGMNLLLGMFMYTMSELDAFYCLNAFVSRCPRYICGTLKGVHHACRLVGKLLKICDPELSAHFEGKVDPSIFAFAPCLSFMASVKPLDDVIRLWDLLLILGPHFGVLFYVTHLISKKNLLMTERSPYRLQQLIGSLELNSTVVIESFLQYLPLIPTDLYEELVHHPFEDINDKPKGTIADNVGELQRSRTVQSHDRTTGNTAPRRSKSVSRTRPEVKSSLKAAHVI